MKKQPPAFFVNAGGFAESKLMPPCARQEKEQTPMPETKQPLVSIIVPVYNAASHIARCIESIRRQTYQNIEIILLNDGSKDVSLQVCEMYAKIDRRIILLDRDNRGVSATRNLGLKLARGEYLQFADSDDYLEPTATETLVTAAVNHQADMVIAPYFRVENVTKLEIDGIYKKEQVTLRGFLAPGFYDKKGFAVHLMEQPASFFYGVMWNKLYRRALVEEHGLACSEELDWSEDLLFNLEYIRYAERFVSVPVPVYYYVKTPGSLVATKVGLKNMVGVVATKAALFTYYKKLYEDIGLYEENKMQIYKYLVAVGADC